LTNLGDQSKKTYHQIKNAKALSNLRNFSRLSLTKLPKPPKSTDLLQCKPFGRDVAFIVGGALVAEAPPSQSSSLLVRGCSNRHRFILVAVYGDKGCDLCYGSEFFSTFKACFLFAGGFALFEVVVVVVLCFDVMVVSTCYCRHSSVVVVFRGGWWFCVVGLCSASPFACLFSLLVWLLCLFVLQGHRLFLFVVRR